MFSYNDFWLQFASSFVWVWNIVSLNNKCLTTKCCGIYLYLGSMK
jgi:hypothetical protein